MDSISNKLQSRLRRQAQQLQGILAALKSALPEDCQSHLEVGGIRDNQLVILTDSAVWQTRLRMYSQSMLESVHQHTELRLSRLIIKVTPPRRSAPVEHHPKRLLSQKSADIIEKTAQSINDADLRKALEKLAKHTK